MTDVRKKDVKKSEAAQYFHPLSTAFFAFYLLFDHLRSRGRWPV